MEARGYLHLLQTWSPGETFHGEQSASEAQVSILLTLLPPPVPKCPQFPGWKTLDHAQGAFWESSSQKELSIWDFRILPNFNASYLSVRWWTVSCQQSGEVSMGSFLVPLATSPIHLVPWRSITSCFS